MDTSLELDLQLNQSNSDLSPSSAASEIAEIVEFDKRSCCQNKFITQGKFSTCFHCGAFVSKNGTKTLKSKRVNFAAFFPSKTIYETMTRRSNKFSQSMNQEYSMIRQTYVEWVLELADKLRISASSSHLAILILDSIMYRDTSLTTKLQLYAPICLFVAAKAIELDERIPFIPKLRRYANPTFSIDDYRRAELHVLDMIEWNPLFSTVLEINEFLMCQGILFSTDGIEDDQAKGGLRENTQHENTQHEKENNENSYSDISTNGTNTENVLTPLTPGVAISQQIEEESSPEKLALPHYQKSDSEVSEFEAGSPVLPIEDKVEEIMTHFETSYVKLSTLLLRDIDFVDFEPRVVSAASVAFFRNANKVTPIWNDELETITQLQFSQISSCFDLIYKKYNNAFNPNHHKILGVLQTVENQSDVTPDLKATKMNSNTTEKIQLKTELPNKPNVVKPTFLYQAKPNVTIVNSGTTTAYNQMRDDLRLRTRYPNGTASTEVPQKNLMKNPVFLPIQDHHTSASISAATTANDFVDYTHSVAFLNDLNKAVLKTDQKMN